MHERDKLQTIGKIDKYILCIVDEYNYGIYDTTSKTSCRRSTKYYGKLHQALPALLERLIKDEIQQTTIKEIKEIVKIVKDATGKIIELGRELDRKADGFSTSQQVR